MDRKIGLGFAFGVALGCAAPALAQQAGNLIVNGGFETGGLGACDHVCPDGLSGWSYDGCRIDWVRTQTCQSFCDPPFVPPEGYCIVDLSGSVASPGAIWQSVALQPGKTYRLSFEFGGNCYDSATKRMSVTIGPVNQEFLWTCGATCYEFGSRQEIEFVAVHATNTLKFSSLSNPNYGPMVDDIRLLEVDPCPGDITGGGVVDGTDLAALLGAWGTSGQGKFTTDLNDDGTVDAGDLSIVLAGWGKCP